jgi:hypothetical protein
LGEKFCTDTRTQACTRARNRTGARLPTSIARQGSPFTHQHHAARGSISYPHRTSQAVNTSDAPPTPPHPTPSSTACCQACSCVFRPLNSGGPVGASGCCGPCAAGAVGPGPVAPARRAISGCLGPWSGESKHVVTMPLLFFRARLQAGR